MNSDFLTLIAYKLHPTACTLTFVVTAANNKNSHPLKPKNNLLFY